MGRQTGTTRCSSLENTTQYFRSKRLNDIIYFHKNVEEKIRKYVMQKKLCKYFVLKHRNAIYMYQRFLSKHILPNQCPFPLFKGQTQISKCGQLLLLLQELSSKHLVSIGLTSLFFIGTIYPSVNMSNHLFSREIKFRG